MDLVDSNMIQNPQIHISKVMNDTTMEIGCICFNKSFMPELIPQSIEADSVGSQ